MIRPVVNEKVSRNKDMYKAHEGGMTFTQVAENFELSLTRTKSIIYRQRKLDEERRKPRRKTIWRTGNE